MTVSRSSSTAPARATVTVDGRSGMAEIGASLFDAAESAGVSVPTSCHKRGRCRECLVEVEAGAECLSERAPEELHLTGQFRLACRARLVTEGEVRAHTLRRGALRIETEAVAIEGARYPLDPAVSRHGNSVLFEGRVIGTCAAPLHGLAIDLGTTTVALRLFDLESGRRVATQAFENPQRFGGSDVLARIHYEATHPGQWLRRTLFGYLSHRIASMPIDPATIFFVAVAGNPTMRDLLFGLDVQGLGVLPYQSVTEVAMREGRAVSTSVTSTAGALRWPLPAGAIVYGLPLVGSHVGADGAACLAATGLGESDELSALLDIGTNTEVFLGNRQRLLAASCPAGPAFEGGRIACGMPALDGAIERVRVRDDGSVDLRTIEDGPPTGICGSGLVDLLSELRRTGRMNEQGRFLDPDTRFHLVDDGRLFLEEADVNELAQAKGANAAGLRVLAETLGTDFGRIDRLYLAGGFARHVDIDAACRIGLIPDLPRDRIVKIGNAALAGAEQVLLSRRCRDDLEALVRRVELVRLEASPHFFDFFVQGCQFVPFGAGA
ncbi:MAG TPA: ASKHA domain-containing protein [Steroidobacteraceae bacterium]|nr:ASKHA domain-containing protein [Steroidobacteraceae bacterium]